MGRPKWCHPSFEIYDPSLPLSPILLRKLSLWSNVTYWYILLPLIGWRHLWTAPNWRVLYLSLQWCMFLVKHNCEPKYFWGYLETKFDGYHPHNPQKFPLVEEAVDIPTVCILENVFCLGHKNIFQSLN